MGYRDHCRARRVVSLTGSWRPRKVDSLYQQALPGHAARLRARHSVVAHSCLLAAFCVWLGWSSKLPPAVVGEVPPFPPADL